MGDEHRVAARQVLVAWSGSGHDQVLYKGGKEKLMLRKCTAHKVEQLSPRQANVTEFLDTEGLPKELGGEDDWQYSWQV